jgi:hypothetical protein
VVRPECREIVPPRVYFSENHWAECHLYQPSDKS